ncbi:putative multidrug export ATP-binding/permease protein [Moorella thermoacetica]|uniref:Putative multidrug export ATP-binding/permease protein n=1 Tax=Neomoorella thermoacetica TaxID=1525 RepID=A0A1J5NRM4_NEOTH|nr:putative multidrug export ATP-binding/permease protein [Moorella thermoacetica]
MDPLTRQDTLPPPLSASPAARENAGPGGHRPGPRVSYSKFHPAGTFARLLGLITPAWQAVPGAIMLGSSTIASNIGLMATAAFLIASAALHPPAGKLMLAIVGVRFFGITRAVCRYLERYVNHSITLGILGRLRVAFYRTLEPLFPAGLPGYHSGDLLSRAVADVATLENFYLRVLNPPLVALAVAAGVFLFLASFGRTLALAWLGAFLAAGVIFPLGLTIAGRGVLRRQGEARAALNTALVDTVQGLADILAFDHGRGQQEYIATLDREYLRLQGRAAGLNGLAAALTGLAGNLALWAVLVLAIPLVNRGQIDGVYLAMLALTAAAALEAALPLPMLFPHLEGSLAAARRLFALSDARPAAGDPPSPVPRPRDFSLQVKGLRFRYGPGEPPALDGIDFTVPSGARIAIVGPSGAGKSTLVNLLLRFWDYEEGAIFLGGYDLKAYPPEELRRFIGVVAQPTHLFHTTIAENLLLARPDATREEMERAAREARLHEFIHGLPLGYDTLVGEEGLKLSGGQRQRLAIARALLKNAPILILDEATTGLDAVTEREVMDSIRHLMEGRTTLVITHRLAGLEDMDKILVLDKGRVVQQGRHAELLRQEGLYRHLWQLQQEALP